MKSLIVYSSKYYNNTEKSARIFAERIHLELINVNHISDEKQRDVRLRQNSNKWI